MTEHPTTELPFIDLLATKEEQARRRRAERELQDYLNQTSSEIERLKGGIDDITQRDK